MVWILGIVGFITGAIAALVNDWPLFDTAVIAALMGVGLGLLLRQRAASPQAQQTRQTATDATPPAIDPFKTTPEIRAMPISLAARVERLEGEVATLRRELAQLRGEGARVQDVPPAMSAPDAHIGPRTEASDAAPREDAPQAVPAATTIAAAAASAASRAHEAAPEEMPATETLAAASAGKNTWTAFPIIPPQPPQPPEEPSGPTFIERLFKAGRDWLLGGNTVVRVGIVVLFFGVAFLLKYAADNSMLPIEFRLAGVAVAASVLLGIGWRIGDRRGAYGLVLQGGGVGVLYLTVFAATRLYALLPAGAAFPLMVAICGLSAFLAVRQDARALAFMGSAGGFLAPVLLATGGGSHVMLFGYYVLLNAGIFAIAWFKAWRPLNLLGFAFTFVIGTAWGVIAYRPALFATTEPFLILFFLMYVGIALLYAVRREIALRHYVDGTLVFGTPLVAIGLQAALVKGVPFGLAWSAVALSAFYLAIAGWLSRRRERLGLLFESMLALAVLFATLAIPLAFSGPTTGAAWAVEGAAIVWLGVRQRRHAPLLFGLAMQVAAAGALATGVALNLLSGRLPVLNSGYIATLLIAGGGVFTGWLLHGRDDARAWHAWLPEVGLAATCWGLLWWGAGGANEIIVQVARRAPADLAHATTNAFVLFAVLTAWLAHAVRRKFAWPLAEWPALALVPALAVLLAAATFAMAGAPFASYGWIVWPVALVCGYLLLWRQQRDVGDPLLAPLHTLMFWTLGVLLAFEGYRTLRAYVPEGAWSWSAWAYGFGLLLLFVAGIGGRLRWPVARFARAYQLWGALPVAALLWLWSIASTVSDGDASPLFWLPIVNPLDVAQLLAATAFAVWLRRLRALGLRAQPRSLADLSGYAALATIFLWFNALLLRTLHHRFGAAYDIDAVFDSPGFQQVFLLGWSAFAFAGIWFARRDSLVRLFAIASTPLVAAMWLWTVYANFTQDGGAWGRVPLVNPLDLVQIVIYAVAALWFMRVRRLAGEGRDPLRTYRLPLQVLVGGTAFLWLNTMLLRTLHHWTGIPYVFDDMAQSTLVQASVSVFWTVCALATTIWATRRGYRALWFVGAALLALTVVKLFLFDLSHVTGLARIVSFIGIGLMLLLIGYFSPLPPKRAARGETATVTLEEGVR